MPRTAAGCPVAPAAFHACAVEKMKRFDPPRMPDGQPNLDGFWTRTVSSQEIELHNASFGRSAGPSLVMDTPDRKIPYQPWAMEFRKGLADRYISPLTACYPGGVPRHIYGPGASRIVQTPQSFLFLIESSHSYRIVPVATHPHLGSAVKLWQGDSRAHWEGNTLVIDVTNNNGLAWLDSAGNFYSDALHVVERFTLVDADTLHYEATLEDPKVYTRPWTIAFGMIRNKQPGFELLEEACREGNQNREGQAGTGRKPWRGAEPPGTTP